MKMLHKNILSLVLHKCQIIIIVYFFIISGFTKSDRVPTNFYTGSIVGTIFIVTVLATIFIFDGLTLKSHLMLLKRNLRNIKLNKILKS